jgi:hypothetical protein
MVRALRAAGYESDNMADQMGLVLSVLNPFLDASFPCLPTKSWRPYISGLQDLHVSVQFPSTRETIKGSGISSRLRPVTPPTSSTATSQTPNP